MLSAAQLQARDGRLSASRVACRIRAMVDALELWKHQIAESVPQQERAA